MRDTDFDRFPRWLPDEPGLSGFVNGVDAFVAQHLSPMIDIADKELSRISSKSIVDPISGYIQLTKLETAFLETRLVQRLRRIRQLSLAYLVYPTLGYSRFEHSLGVLARVQQLVARLREAHKQPSPINARITQAIASHELSLRLAALFHDIGHCIFSHVSENVIARLPGDGGYWPTERICKSISEYLQSRKTLAPAEALSVAIVSSPHLRQLASRIDVPDRTDEKLNDWFQQAARFIGGAPARDNPDTVFLAQLISGGLDADKLDYMTRESHFSRIPLGIDLDRLLDKLRVFDCTSSELPRDLAYLTKSMSGDSFLVLGLGKGAQFAFEEFCIARVPLYDKIYLHQKVRAAEAQLKSLLSEVPTIVPAYREMHRWLWLKESMIEHDELPIPEQGDLGVLFQAQLRTSKDLKFEPIRDRVLLVRAFGFGLRNSLSESPGYKDDSPTLRLLRDARVDASAFLSDIRSEIIRICDRAARKRPTEDELGRIIVDVPNHNRVQQGANSLYLEHPSTLAQRWSFPIDQITRYYAESRALAYVFAPREWSDVVTLAVEKAIWSEYSIQFEQADAISAEVAQRSKKLRVTLAKGDYYEDAQSLKPLTAYLLTPSAQEQVRRIVTNLQVFVSHRNDRVTPSTVLSFAMQFSERLQPPLLELCTKIEVVYPKTIAEAIAQKVAERPLGMTGTLIAPLGNLTDSANHLLYYFKNHLDSSVREIAPNIRQLTEYEMERASSVVLFDDNINSASQAVNIVAQWLAVPLPKGWDLKEKHVEALSPVNRERLKNMPLTFVFGVGPEDAPSALNNALVDVCGLDPSNVTVHIDRLLRVNERLLSGKEAKMESKKSLLSELREFLRTVGTEIMAGEGKSDDAALARALGDSGTEAAIVFPYNVPTMTITALWCAGPFHGRPWQPLVERRRNRHVDGKFAGEDA